MTMAIFIKLDHPLNKNHHLPVVKGVNLQTPLFSSTNQWEFGTSMIPIIFPNLPIPGLHGDFLSLELAVVDLRHAAAAHQGA